MPSRLTCFCCAVPISIDYQISFTRFCNICKTIYSIYMLIWHYHYFPMCTICMVPSILPGTLCVVWPFQVQLYSIMWKAGYSPEGSEIYRSLKRTWPGKVLFTQPLVCRLSEVVPHWGSRVALHFSSEVVAQTKKHCASWFTPPVIHLHPAVCMVGRWTLNIEHCSSKAMHGAWAFKQGHCSSYARVGSLHWAALRSFILAWSPNSKSCLHHQVKGDVEKNSEFAGI